MSEVKNTKSQIIDVSLKLFSEKSYHGSSIRDIAKEVGIRESAIYNHFKSKNEILSEIINLFASRNIGTLILTDELINILSKPQIFFIMLSNNIVNFWNSDKERMFIKLLMNLNSITSNEINYTLENYLEDFRKLCSFIFDEMIHYKFLKNIEVRTLSKEFISPLFLVQINILNKPETFNDYKKFLKKHSDFIWEAVKL